MRILITATPGLSAIGSVPPLAMGGLDLRTRFAREDAGFDVVFADPDEDLAEQVTDVLSRRSCGPRDSVMLYIAARTLLSREGELYLCLDPEEPNIGDALALREFAEQRRQQGESTGGPAPMTPKDRSRFLAKLDETIHAARKVRR